MPKREKGTVTKKQARREKRLKRRKDIRALCILEVAGNDGAFKQLRGKRRAMRIAQAERAEKQAERIQKKFLSRTRRAALNPAARRQLRLENKQREALRASQN